MNLAYGFGHITGNDHEGHPFEMLTRISARQLLKGPVHILAKRSMDALLSAGMVSEKGDRSLTQWMHDEGVHFHWHYHGSHVGVSEAYKALGGVFEPPPEDM